MSLAEFTNFFEVSRFAAVKNDSISSLNGRFGKVIEGK